LELLEWKGIGDRFPAIILMTDGRSNEGSIQQVKDAIAKTGLDNVPIYGITFGDADKSQLDALAELTGGRVFDGTKDLISAFRAAKGNN
jgi:Ca-activated chloride channel family protein